MARIYKKEDAPTEMKGNFGNLMKPVAQIRGDTVSKQKGQFNAQYEFVVDWQLFDKNEIEKKQKLPP